MPYTQSANRVLHYVQLPSDRGPGADHVVLVHGLAASMAFWYFNIAPHLARKFNVTLYDLRGHGRSRMPRAGYAPRPMAEDLKALLDCLDIPRAHIIAHSYGGLIALHFAHLYPQRVTTMTVADSHLSSVRHSSRRWEHGRKIQSVLSKHGLEVDTNDPFFGYRMLKEAAKLQVAGKQEDLEALRDWVHPFIGRSGKRGARQWLRLLETTEAEQEIFGNDGLSDSLLTQLRSPTLAVYGENSQALGSGRQLAGLVKGADFIVVPGAGHFFPASRPKVLLGAWSRFSERHTHH